MFVAGWRHALQSEWPFIIKPTHSEIMYLSDYYLLLTIVCLSAVVGGMLCKSDKPSIIIIIIIDYS